MKLRNWLHALVGVCVVAGTVACEPQNTGNNTTPDEDVDHYERTMLLEQFTSESCVNCPNGVAQIEAWLKLHPNVIWLGHHAGFKDDQWTIKGSKSIVNLLGVSGAPQVALDRSYLVADGAAGYSVHPYYLSYLGELPSSMTTASVRIYNTYEGGKLQIRVAGKLKPEAPKDMRLTVVVKENGLHGQQSDGNMLAGMWSDYVHSDVVRSFVSAVGGDSLVVSDSTYEMTYEVVPDEKWVKDNCMVVAFLTDSKSLNVVQAAQKPMIAGTKGGADLPHGGVTPKAVSEGYPEGKFSVKDFLKVDTVEMQHVQVVSNKLQNGMREWHIQTWAETPSYGSGQNIYIPYADIVLFSEGSVKELPTEGVWPLRVARNLEEIAAHTAWAGYCDLEAQKVIGSELVLVNKALFDAGQIVPGTNGTWLIAEGEVRLTAETIEVDALSATGKPILLRVRR